ncbi:MAG TPA: hypothetical protein VJ654_07365 [Noviherbaspirillum sp.]|nr:hypothetical protein [Noviherbaspirillum sp.]
MTTTVFDKTEKGREEITTRKYQLAPRLRTLLVMIDGKQSADELLQKVGGLGLNQESIGELLENGFIHVIAAPAPVATKETVVPTPEPIPEAPNTPVSNANQFQALYQFYTETIKSMIGLRGYSLQLKVEKASSVEDFRELRQPYLDAVLKAKGNEIAQSLAGRLDQLLGS